jgi:hypothetical protein
VDQRSWCDRVGAAFVRNEETRRTTMHDQVSELTRRSLLATSAAVGLGSALLGDVSTAIAVGGSGAIRPFQKTFPDSALADMRRRSRVIGGRNTTGANAKRN